MYIHGAIDRYLSTSQHKVLIVNMIVEMGRSRAYIKPFSLQWRHNERDGGSNHQPHDCLLNRLVGHRSN